MIQDQRAKIEAVLATIPQEQYADAYVDPTGKEGFRNPVRPIVALGLTEIVARLNITDGTELGTALGSSGGRMGLGGLLRLDTVEYEAEAAAQARKNFEAMGLSEFVVHNMDSGLFVAEYKKPIPFLFIDHAKPRYLDDLRGLEHLLTPNAIVLLDNTFNRQLETKDAAAYVADNYYSGIFTEPSTGGETTGLMIASKDREVFDTAWAALMDVRAIA